MRAENCCSERSSGTGQQTHWLDFLGGSTEQRRLVVVEAILEA